ncbi:glycoside hydrolase superfamily [Scenedesmus sp. NREL 46B-D3]|nr:glycoside hydrolase superfamily [Scenedesmus sp. NREL 46B-D3]
MRPAEAIPVYVMLPLDTVNAEGVFRYAYIPWFAQALHVLALSGVHGVAVDVWVGDGAWCAVERAPRQYSWTGYRQLFEMVRGAGLKLQVVLSFHACGGNVGDLARVPLPSWVLEAGQQDPDIFFTDRPRECGLGRRNKEYLRQAQPAAGVRELMAAFRDAFAEQLGSLVEEVVVGAGPCGELRCAAQRLLLALQLCADVGVPTGARVAWRVPANSEWLVMLCMGRCKAGAASTPSYVEANGWRFPGVGEFQCYDRRALASLAAAASAAGHPEWGYAGPHDSGGYNSSPGDTGFFAPGGSWGTEYGSFFLNWYSSCLLQHGERLLQLANHVFGPHKEPKQPLQGSLAQAQAVARRLQSLIISNSSGDSSSMCDSLGSCSSSSSSSLTAVAAAATVAAAAAAGGLDRDVGCVAAAARQAKGLLQHIQHLQLQQQHSGTPSFLAAKSSSSSSSSSSSDDEGGSSAAQSPSIGSAAATPISCSSTSASTSCLTPQGSLPLLSLLPEQQQQQQQLVGSAAAAAAGGAATSIWDRLLNPQAQALATSILQQLQLQDSSDAGSSLALMAAGTAAASVPVVRAAATDGASADAAAALAAAAAAGMPPPVAATTGAALGATAAAAAADASHSSSDSSSVLLASASGGPFTGLAAAAAAAAVAGDVPGTMDCSIHSISSGSLEFVAAAAATAQCWVLHQHLQQQQLQQRALLADNLNGLDGQQQQQQQQLQWRRQQQQRLVLTLKIAGVHWWYNSTSHASELTAGYYNTDTRDGYSPILQLCEKHGVNLTLTCVEMCDTQHPSYALCGPEGLLRQIRAMAARQRVTLSGENALPIFTPGGSSGGGSSSSGSSWHWQQQQQQVAEAPGNGMGLHDTAGAASSGAASNSHGSATAGSSGGAVSGEVLLLPAMRAFTFLRLGPEVLQPDCHANWMRFMHRMLNERA